MLFHDNWFLFFFQVKYYPVTKLKEVGAVGRVPMKIIYEGVWQSLGHRCLKPCLVWTWKPAVTSPSSLLL